MRIQILILMILIPILMFVLSLYVKEGYEEYDYKADMFASNDCPSPCVNCLDKTSF